MDPPFSMCVSSNLLISQSDHKHCFPEVIRNPVLDFFFFLFHFWITGSKTGCLLQTNFTTCHRASRYLHRTSLYRHVGSLLTAQLLLQEERLRAGVSQSSARLLPCFPDLPPPPTRQFTKHFSSTEITLECVQHPRSLGRIQSTLSIERK